MDVDMKRLTRRDFLILSAKGIGFAVVSTGLMGCDPTDGDRDVEVEFLHGVASGDPSQDSIILWTRVTPKESATISVTWEIATDSAFNHIVHNGSTQTTQANDYTVKIDAINLEAGREYFYRFHANGKTSNTGKTKTLPEGVVNSVKLAVLSCANYPAGFFNVYNFASQIQNIDAAIHLGDYIYEYPVGGYASEHAAQINREVLPATELFSLSDYRTRYAQYREDEELQLVHASMPFITVWDDHEVANDTFKDGAENHNDNEGSFENRKLAALQAYFEWLPIRPIQEGNHSEIYRSFRFGDLVDLHMLDTRVLARDQQLSFTDYVDPTSDAFNSNQFQSDIQNASRTMLGQQQLTWLESQFSDSQATWQVLGQQVLMGKMYLPGAVAIGAMSVEQYSELGSLAALGAKIQANDPSLTPEQIAYFVENQDKLSDAVLAQLQLPNMPYNLDAWDGYANERESIFQLAKSNNHNLIVLAGDTHNAWCNNLVTENGEHVGVEFATASVSSPGLESYLSIAQEAAPAFEAGITALIENLEYCNLYDRGVMVITFTATKATSQWYFVDTILDRNYITLDARFKQMEVVAGDNIISN